MTDILKHCYVDVHCGQCGEFAVRADIIAESQRMLAQGCPGSTYECPPALLATLLEPAALESLERAWSTLEGAAHEPVRHLSIGDSLYIQLRAGDPTDPDARGVSRPSARSGTLSRG